MKGTSIGPYQVLDKLGVGGMGEVWRARDTQLGREVALKALPVAFAADPDRLMRFEREARTLAALNHPHIAQIYGLVEAPAETAGESPRRALVMELVEGEDLAARITRGPVPIDEALAIARQIAEALEAAHENGVVHRDLKPANVRLRPDGAVKVLDFGLATLPAGALAASGPGPLESPAAPSGGRGSRPTGGSSPSAPRAGPTTSR
jgi:eukaryotic-like serine/threonine-protein kinase